MNESVMVPIYVKLVQAGKRDLASVPENLRSLVEQALNEPVA